MNMQNNNSSDLMSELEDLQVKTKEALAKLETINQNHFKMVTRNSVASYPQNISEKVDSILTDFERASSLAKKIDKVVKNIKGPEPKLC